MNADALLQEVELLCALYGDRYVNQTLHLPLESLTEHKASDTPKMQDEPLEVRS